MATPATIAADIVANPYAWPGGYERWALTDDCGELCRDCCEKEAARIGEATPGDGWYVVGSMMACDVDEPSRCDHCNAPLLPSSMSREDYDKRNNRPADYWSLASIVARIKAEILECIECGSIPATVATFAELHDYFDANEFGGLCEDDAPGILGNDDQSDVAEQAQCQVDAWLRAGRPVGPLYARPCLHCQATFQPARPTASLCGPCEQKADRRIAHFARTGHWPTD